MDQLEPDKDSDHVGSCRKGFMYFCYSGLAVRCLALLSNYGLWTSDFMRVCLMIPPLSEDCVLFTTQVRPTIQSSSPLSCATLIAEASIQVTFFFAVLCMAQHSKYFCLAVALWSLSKLCAGILHWHSCPDAIDWRCGRYAVFLFLPTAAAASWRSFTGDDDVQYLVIFCVWALQTLLWWGITWLDKTRKKILQNRIPPSGKPNLLTS
jgi:hypothetical protein